MPLRKLDTWFGKIQDGLLTLILVVMIVLAFTQVLLRNFFNTGLTWADPVVRHLVLCVGFIGASVATKEHGHLAMDLVTRFAPERFKKISSFFIHLASSIVCALLAHASYKFVLSEKEAGAVLLPGVPTYWAIIIIPIGFLIMSIRFALRIITDFQNFPPKADSSRSSAKRGSE